MVGFPIQLSLLPYNDVFYYTQEIDSYFLSLSIQDQNSALLNVLELKTDYCLIKRKLYPRAGEPASDLFRSHLLTSFPNLHLLPAANAQINRAFWVQPHENQQDIQEKSVLHLSWVLPGTRWCSKQSCPEAPTEFILNSLKESHTGDTEAGAGISLGVWSQPRPHGKFQNPVSKKLI